MTPQPIPLKNLVIRASAGTGKTFQLSNRFLRLALDGTPLDTILATTFTRKAAGEILDRVLSRLAEAALDPAKCAALAAQLDRPGLTCDECLAVVGAMVRQLHRLRVGTLDSVFVQMARSFSLELGLPPGWQIADDPADRRLRGEAIREMLENESTHDTLRLMHLLSKGQAARSVSREILDLVNDLYAIYLDAPPEAWSALGRRKSLSADQLAAALTAIRDVPLPESKHYTNARRDDVARVEAEQWEKFLSTGLAIKIADGSMFYQRKPIPPEVAVAYQPLIDHATAQVINGIAAQNEATREMLARFEQAYTRLQAARRVLRFDDVTRRLGEADGRPVEHVVYRLDAHLNHLLLDEFQDTSPVQWRILRRFAERIVARPGDTFFCVGDVKQAIYGWRGGVAEILEAISGQLKPLDAAALNKSYRSSPVVIDVVNRVFERLATNDALADHQSAARAWAARFAPHSTALENMPGYCLLESAPAAGEDERQDDVTLDWAARRVAWWHAAAPGRSIGVLVRRNKSVGRLIYRLRRQGIAASEEGGNPLVDSPAVQLILSVLRLADHPGDTASRFHVARSPLAEPLGLPRFDDDRAAWRLSADLRRRLLADGFGPTLFRWTTLLAPHCDPRELNRLGQLVELGYGHEPQATARADDFIDMVEQKKVDDPSSSQVRVMTIHQAKGLQFDVVVLPELDYRLAGQLHPTLVVGRPDPTEPIERVCRYVGEKIRPILPHKFIETFDRDRRQRVEESLCLLYVAMTRAVNVLDMLVAPSKANESKFPATSAAILRAALAGTAPVEPGASLHEQGDPNCLNQTCATAGLPSSAVSATGFASGSPTSDKEGKTVLLTGGASGTQATEAITIHLAKPTHRLRRGLDRRSPSQLGGGPRVDLASRIHFDTNESRLRGTVIHAWFERIEWLDGDCPIQPGDCPNFRLSENGTVPFDGTIEAQLLALARQHTSDEAAVRRWLADFHAALSRPTIRAVFNHAQYVQHSKPGGEVRLWRERPFAIRQNDALLSGTIDRLVVCHENGKPTTADVLDFKSDHLPPDNPAAIAARVDFYRPQMQAYASAIAAMFHLPPERISTRLVFIDPGVVQDV